MKESKLLRANIEDRNGNELLIEIPPHILFSQINFLQTNLLNSQMNNLKKYESVYEDYSELQECTKYLKDKSLKHKGNKHHPFFNCLTNVCIKSCYNELDAFTDCQYKYRGDQVLQELACLKQNEKLLNCIQNVSTRINLALYGIL